MTKKTDFTRKLDAFITSSKISDLHDKLIYQDDRGVYHLFNRYTITKTCSGNFIVMLKNSDTSHTFTSLKVATAWCVYDQKNRFYDSDRIKTIDSTLCSLHVDITQHSRMISNRQCGNKYILLTKLEEERMKVRMLTAEMRMYTNNARHWQIQKFSEK